MGSFAAVFLNREMLEKYIYKVGYISPRCASHNYRKSSHELEIPILQPTLTCGVSSNILVILLLKSSTQYFFLIMLSNTQLSVALALIALTNASPIEPRGLAFTVKQSVAKDAIKSGPAAMAATYAKYSKQAPANVTAAAANNDGTVAADPTQYDSEYLCPVSIGGQTLNLDFDTGSSDLYVFLDHVSNIPLIDISAGSFRPN